MPAPDEAVIRVALQRESAEEALDLDGFASLACYPSLMEVRRIDPVGSSLEQMANDVGALSKQRSTD
jgi:hypothetical protein